MKLNQKELELVKKREVVLLQGTIVGIRANGILKKGVEFVGVASTD